MYDFAHPVSDAIEGITHSLCSLEFENHRPLYNWFVEKAGFELPLPRQIEFARLNITNMLMSKRYLKKLVDEGVVSGWDDERMPTIAGLKKQGRSARGFEKILRRYRRCKGVFHRKFRPARQLYPRQSQRKRRACYGGFKSVEAYNN